MKRKLNLEMPLIQALNHGFDLIFLNLLWLLTSLPVITMGASTAAMCRVTLDMRRGKGGGLFKSFFSAWKENWKQATALWIPTAAVLAVFFFLFHSFNLVEGPLAVPVQLTVCLITLVVLLINVYAYSYLGFFADTLPVILRNSLYLALRKLPVTALMLLIILLPALLLIFATELLVLLGIFWLLIGVAFSSYINAKWILQAFEQVFLKESSSPQP